MKNQFLRRIIILFILFLSLFVNFSCGFIKDDYTLTKILVIGWEGEGNTSNKILADLKSKLGYERDSLTKEMIFKTYLKIVEVDGKKYKIQFRRKWSTNKLSW